MKRITVVSILASLLVLASVAAAQPWGGWRGSGGWGMKGGNCGPYDATKAETIKGEVVSVEQVTPRRGMGPGIALKLNSGDETLSVILGPQWYVERQDIKIVAGDEVEVAGVKTVRRGQDVFLAAEVKKGGDILKIRDEDGYPAWAGWRRGMRK